MTLEENLSSFDEEVLGQNIKTDLQEETERQEIYYKIKADFGVFSQQEWEKIKNVLDKDSAMGCFMAAKYIMGLKTFKTVRDNEEIYYYSKEDGIWKPLGDRLIKSILGYALCEEQSNHVVNEVVGVVKRLTYIDRTEFNPDRDKICLKNGVYDLTTGELLDFSPDFMMTSACPVTFDLEAECPRILSFLETVVEPEDVELLKEIAGYCFYGSMPFPKAFVLVGDGSNGKSTYLSLLEKMLGDDNVSNMPMQSLDPKVNRFAVAQIYGKLANICADIPADGIRNTGAFKMLVGGDRVYAEQKFKDGFSYINTTKLVFSANQVPKTDDMTDAFFRRIVMIDFPHIFPVNDEYKKALMTDQERSGFFNVCMKSLKNLLAGGKFTNEQTTDELRERYLIASDSVANFVINMLEEAPVDVIPKQEVWKSYSDFCRRGKMPVKNIEAFGREMPKYISAESCKTGEKGRQVTAWRGIKIMKTEPIPPEPMKTNPKIDDFLLDSDRGKNEESVIDE